MTAEEAKEYARVNHTIDIRNSSNAYATSDGAFYFNADTSILASHAKENSLEIFTLKGDEIKKAKPEKIKETSQN